MSTNLTLLRRAFVDVCRGYSLGSTRDGVAIYIRHLGHREHESFDLLQERFEKEAVDKGALTEKQALERLFTQGVWSPDRETQIERQKEVVSRLEEGKKNIPIASIMKSQEEQIAREKETLKKLLIERAQLLGTTAEIYAHSRLDDYYLVSNLFADSSFQTSMFAMEDFDNLTDEEVEAVHGAYKIAIEPCADTSLRRLAVQDFFLSYFYLCGDDIGAFFGKPICEMTYYQVRLLNHARYFKALLDNTDLNRLPADQRGDPDAIERLHITQKNMDKMKEEGKVPVGLSSTDIKENNIQFSPLPPPSLSGVELVRWMQKNQSLAPR